jgi:hypothetical protein
MSRRRSSKALKRHLDTPREELSLPMRAFLWIFRSEVSSVLSIALFLATSYGLQAFFAAAGLNLHKVLITFFGFLILGVFLGVVMVTELDNAYAASGSRIRIISGVVAGASIAIMGNLSFEGVVLAGLLVGALGYFGIYWAKFL